MILAAECNSWPICYRDDYAVDVEHQACLARYAACYPNSGVLLASVETLLKFYDVWAQAIVHPSHTHRAERWNDQAAVHRIYQNRSQYAANGGFALRVDAESLFSLQLWKCEGPKEHSMRPFEFCHERSHDPTTSLRTEDGGQSVIYTDSLGTVRRPFLVHSNGHHYVLREEESHLGPLLQLYSRPSSALLSHPVMLVDTFHHGVCNITTLGWLMNAAKWPQDAPALQLQSTRL